MPMPLRVNGPWCSQLKKRSWLRNDITISKAVSYHIILSQLCYSHDLAEWLTAKLQTCYHKWEQIDREIDLRRLQTTIKKGGDKSDAQKPNINNRADLRLYGSGGAVEKLLRDEYQRGLNKMCTSSFASKAAKEEWLAFVDQLEQDGMLGLVTDDTWE
jgi:hypothetical protein